MVISDNIALIDYFAKRIWSRIFIITFFPSKSQILPFLKFFLMNTIIVSQQKWYASKHKYAMIGKIQVDRHNKSNKYLFGSFQWKFGFEL